MIAHIEEGILQAYLDGEVGARAEIDEHLAACTECAAELARLRAAAQLFATAVHNADITAPTLSALAEVRARRPQPLRPPVTVRPRAFVRVPLAKAAMLMVGLAAVASAAIPGSPVRALISDALRIVGGSAEDAPISAEPSTPAAEPVFESGSDVSAALSIQPAQGKVRVILTGVADQATIRVRLIESDRATVQASGAAAHARFRTGPGRIEVLEITGGDVAIDLPRSVMDARVEVDGRMIFQKDHGQLHLTDPMTTGTKSEFVFKR